MKIIIKHPAPVQLWRVLHNPAVPMDGRPDVVITSEYSAVPMTEAIQRLSYDLFCWGVGSAVPDADKPRKWRMVYGGQVAFTNFAGFEDATPRRDYINKLDLTAELPVLQKALTIAGAKVSGHVVGDYLELDTLSPANVPSLAWLIDHPQYYFEAKTVNQYGQARFPQGNGAPVYVPWFCQVGKVARLPLSGVIIN